MAELLCFSVDDFIVLSCNFCNSSSVIASYFFLFSLVSKTAAETAREHDSCAHRRCCAIRFVDDESRALFFGG